MSLPRDCLDVVASFVAAADREIDDVALDARNLARAGHPDLSAAVWARVAAIADRMGSLDEEAERSGCVTGRRADRWMVARLARAAGVARPYVRPMYQLLDEMSASTAPVHPRYCAAPQCVALYVLHMACRSMAPAASAVAFRDRDLRHPRWYGGGHLLSWLRRAPPLPKRDRRAEERAEVDAYLAAHDVAARPFWVKDVDDARRLVRRRELDRMGLPACMAAWFGARPLPEFVASARRYADVAEALGETIERTFGRQHGYAYRACNMLLYRAVRRLGGRSASVFMGTSLDLSGDGVRAVLAQIERAAAILDETGCRAGASVRLGSEARVTIDGVAHSLCPPAEVSTDALPAPP